MFSSALSEEKRSGAVMRARRSVFMGEGIDDC
jgi:hypothetical protein